MVKKPKIPKLPKAPKLKIPKMRSKIYKPSWKQIGKKPGGALGFPPIKIKSD
jgi:hypothetical protein